MACLKLGRPGRFFYRLRVHRRRKGERRSMSEADYAHLVTAAHHAPNAPMILIWDGLNAHRSRKMRAFTEARHHRPWAFNLCKSPDVHASPPAYALLFSIILSACLSSKTKSTSHPISVPLPCPEGLHGHHPITKRSA
jgi:putative transposase